MKEQFDNINNTYKVNSLNGYKVQKAIQILIDNIDSIPNVQKWTTYANVSRGWLYNILNENYGTTPSNILKEIRYEKVIQLVLDDIEATAYCVAKDSGLPSENSLRMFLRRYKETNFRKLRRQIINNELQIEWKWLESE